MSLDGIIVPKKLGNYLLGDKLGAGFSGTMHRGAQSRGRSNSRAQAPSIARDM
jgi:hypothetical protein